VVSRPPAITPTPPPIPVIVAYTPSARFRALPSGNVTEISDRAAGAAMAAPIPWAAREAISHHERVANPPASEARLNTRIPRMNMRRRPKMSPEPAEQQQAAEGDGVGVDHPLQPGPREVQGALDVRQRRVDDQLVQHQHQLGHGDDGKGQP
jgi:hypothetical protein